MLQVGDSKLVFADSGGVWRFSHAKRCFDSLLVVEYGVVGALLPIDTSEGLSTGLPCLEPDIGCQEHEM